MYLYLAGQVINQEIEFQIDTYRDGPTILTSLYDLGVYHPTNVDVGLEFEISYTNLNETAIELVFVDDGKHIFAIKFSNENVDLSSASRRSFFVRAEKARFNIYWDNTVLRVFREYENYLVLNENIVELWEGSDHFDDILIGSDVMTNWSFKIRNTNGKFTQITC